MQEFAVRNNPSHPTPATWRSRAKQLQTVFVVERGRLHIVRTSIDHINVSLHLKAKKGSHESKLDRLPEFSRMQVFNVTANNLKTLGPPLASLPKLHTIIARENKLAALKKTDLQGLKWVHEFTALRDWATWILLNPLTCIGLPVSLLLLLVSSYVKNDTTMCLCFHHDANLDNNSRVLSFLDVSKNLISFIEDGAFLNVPLKKLDLSQNRIKALTPNMLAVSGELFCSECLDVIPRSIL